MSSIKKSLKYAGKNHPSNNPLLCPNCKECYMHQEHVDVLFRKEDAEEGTVVSVDYNEVKTSKNVHDFNLCEGRRDTIKIYFSCEQCDYHLMDEDYEDPSWIRKSPRFKKYALESGKTHLFDDDGEIDPKKITESDWSDISHYQHILFEYPVMSIVQHKGCTYIGWS